MSPRMRCGTVATLVSLLVASAAPAAAQGKLDARYNITLAGLSIGQVVWAVHIGEDGYTTAANGGARGLLRVLVAGHGEASTQGFIHDGIPVPVNYAMKLTSDDEAAAVSMRFDGRNVTDLSIAGTVPREDRVPPTEQDRRNVLDPLTAMIVPIGGSTDLLSPGENLSVEVCRPVLPVFDGLRRYNLRLTYKRIDRANPERGYRGPVIVCGLTYQPVSGHRAGSPLLRYLTEGRDMEVWFAPIAGTHLAVPIRMVIGNLIGSIVVQATQFDMVSLATERATIMIGPGGGPITRPRRPGE